jgi:hypothetical protein
MDQTSQDQAPPTRAERAAAIAHQEQGADFHEIVAPIAMSLGKTVTDYRRLDDGGLSITTEDGATTVVDAGTVAAKRAEWTTEEKLVEIVIEFIRPRDAGTRNVRLARRLGRGSAHVPFFYRDEAGVKRTGSKSVKLAPRRASASRGTGRAARQATNHRSAGSRRGAASSSTSSADPGDSDPEPPAPPLRPAPSPRAVFAFGLLTAEQRGEVIA